MATTRVRLSPDDRREQLLDLGIELLATRSLDELSIDLLAEEAGCTTTSATSRSSTGPWYAAPPTRCSR
jgi:AcrR family transcriptional regulator